MIEPDQGGGGPPHAPLWSRGCGLGPATLELSGNDRADLDWHADFLEPWCAGAAPPGAPRLTLIRSADAFEALERHRLAEAEAGVRPVPVDCIRLDRQMAVFDGWRETKGWRLFDAVSGCHFRIGARGIEIIAPPGQDRSRIALAGTAREAITGWLARIAPCVDLHAAGFAISGQVILVAGPKMAGKTTVLCHALVSEGADLLANDRVMVRLDGAGAVACGVPTRVSIRQGTLERFPQLRARQDRFPDSAPVVPPAFVPAAFAAAKAEAPALTLSAAGLAGRLGVSHRSQGPVRAILVPQREAGLSGWRLEPLRGSAAVARLAEGLYGRPEDRDRATLFGTWAQVSEPVRSTPAEHLRILAERVPIFLCRIGHDLYDRPLTPLLRAIGVETNSCG